MCSDTSSRVEICTNNTQPPFVVDFVSILPCYRFNHVPRTFPLARFTFLRASCMSFDIAAIYTPNLTMTAMPEPSANNSHEGPVAPHSNYLAHHCHRQMLRGDKGHIKVHCDSISSDLLENERMLRQFVTECQWIVWCARCAVKTIKVEDAPLIIPAPLIVGVVLSVLFAICMLPSDRLLNAHRTCRQQRRRRSEPCCYVGERRGVD